MQKLVYLINETSKENLNQLLKKFFFHQLRQDDEVCPF